MKHPIWLSTLAILALVLLIPLFFGQFMVASLTKLHLSPQGAFWTVIAIFAGSLVNLPIARYAHEAERTGHPLAVYGLGGFWPKLGRTTRETILAVNVGGCIVPTALALYQIWHLIQAGDPVVLGMTALTCAITIGFCYFIAWPEPGVGIVIPGLLPPLIAVVCALMLAPGEAAPVAFVAGVLGPLIGADLLHLKEVRDQVRDATSEPFGVVSIGGAGTFDGIVLSGVLAAYLA